MFPETSHSLPIFRFICLFSVESILKIKLYNSFPVPLVCLPAPLPPGTLGISFVFHVCNFSNILKLFVPGSSLVVQWLRLRAFTAVAWIQSLVGKLRSHKPHGAAKNKNSLFLSTSFCSLFSSLSVLTEVFSVLCTVSNVTTITNSFIFSLQFLTWALTAAISSSYIILFYLPRTFKNLCCNSCFTCFEFEISHFWFALWKQVFSFFGWIFSVWYLFFTVPFSFSPYSIFLDS